MPTNPFSAPSLVIKAPYLENVPTFSSYIDLVAQNLTTSSPEFGAPSCRRLYSLRANALSPSSPVFGTPTIGHPKVSFGEFSEILYRSATPLERAMTDADAERLVGIEAEKIIDTWDPYKCPLPLLPYLAWAMGVNLWEDWWSESTRRDWTARQWYLKSIRGTRAGLNEFIKVMGGTVKRVITPPAITYPSKSMTDEERAAYVARFAQLRLYPYYPRRTLPYLCWLGNHHNTRGGVIFSRNGSFLGPLRKFYPTNYDQGGLYTRTATLWDKGVETPLTFFTTTMVKAGSQVVTDFDEVALPGHNTNKYFIGQKGKYPRPANTFTGKTTYGIFLGRLDPTDSILVRIPRDGSLELSLSKAQYQTIIPSAELIEVYPEHVATIHQRRLTETYGQPRGEYLFKKFLPPSNAYQYFYERWYLQDYDRVPDNRKASLYLGHSRLGIHKYTAEAKIKMDLISPKFWIASGRYVRGYLRPQNTEALDRLRRGAVASKALRDTILLDTMVMRPLQLRDLVVADGTHYVGQMVED